ncbi:MAG: Uncharacterised protein [Formosa sp. Hel3_A1_48]|nr:MAG: Uncharacterised protein [Formosa sp. Hel3_A1_48]
MKKLFQLALVLFIISCQTNPKHNTTISAKIKGFQKGTVYLQKFQDTAYVTLDSLVVKGKEVVEFDCHLEEPEMLYLSLSKAVDAERISFFADAGTTTIDTRLKQFAMDAKIEGSQQQKLIEDYRKNLERFKNLHLDLLEASINSKRVGDKDKIDSIQNKMDKNLKRQYLYSINFAINNNDSEVAPYIALSDVFDAKSSFLDSIYNSLTPRISESKYGVLLKEYLEKINLKK